MEFLDQVFLGNTVRVWAEALGIFLGAYILIRIFKYILIKYLKDLSEKTATTIDDFLIEVVEKSVVPAAYFGVVYLAMHHLKFPPRVYNIIDVAILFIMTFYGLRVITSAIKYAVYNFLDKQEDSDVKKKQARGILIIVNVIIWALGIVFLLDNLGHDVTAIIAGLGVGGIAIALAAQTILGDLFSYFVIFFDQPFEIGDFVSVGTDSGTVEYVGVKTTRIRTLTGDVLVCSNTDLTNSRIHNFKKLQERRIGFDLGVIYQTKHQQLKAIPGMIRTIIEGVEGVRFDRSHFSGYGDFSLNFNTIYYVLDQDYAVYMDKQQEIYLAIFKKFEEEGIVFAYPTKTIFLSMEEQDKLNVNAMIPQNNSEEDDK